MRAAIEASMAELRNRLDAHIGTVNFNKLKLMAAQPTDSEFFKILRKGDTKILLALPVGWAESTAIVKVIDDPSGRYKQGDLVETNAQTALDMIINGKAVYGEV
jgi:hypothetical protein